MVGLIGAGFGRTGTFSLKAAVERLGFAPCHHMIEVFGHPEQIPAWHAAARGERVDWHALLAGYRATLDWPSCRFWRELCAAFPDAPVLLSVREPESWWTSFSATILGEFHGVEPPADPGRRAWWEMAREVIAGDLGPDFHDRDKALAAFERHVAEVRAGVPADRLLVFDVREGWEPLCAFLGVPVPDEPFPRSNSTEEFLAHAAARRA